MVLQTSNNTGPDQNVQICKLNRAFACLHMLDGIFWLEANHINVSMMSLNKTETMNFIFHMFFVSKATFIELI